MAQSMYIWAGCLLFRCFKFLNHSWLVNANRNKILQYQFAVPHLGNPFWCSKGGGELLPRWITIGKTYLFFINGKCEPYGHWRFCLPIMCPAKIVKEDLHWKVWIAISFLRHLHSLHYSHLITYRTFLFVASRTSGVFFKSEVGLTQVHCASKTENFIRLVIFIHFIPNRCDSNGYY